VRHAMTLVEMEVRALLILKQLKVRVIVIDEVHNLLAGSPREQRVIPQLFQHLSNELMASLVFLGIAEAREAIAGDTQLSRRLDQMALPRWKLDEPANDAQSEVVQLGNFFARMPGFNRCNGTFTQVVGVWLRPS